MILVVADNFLSAFPPIESLLSPLDAAVSDDLKCFCLTIDNN